MQAMIALYKAPGTRLDRLIRWRTRSQYSHVELVIGSSWYTSSPRDGGVRRREIVPRDGHWDMLPVEMDHERVVRLYARTMGQGYDWLGIAGHAVGVPRINWPTRWTCSEWVAEALGLPRAWRWTPEGLWASATKKPTWWRAFGSAGGRVKISPTADFYFGAFSVLKAA